MLEDEDEEREVLDEEREVLDEERVLDVLVARVELEVVAPFWHW